MASSYYQHNLFVFNSSKWSLAGSQFYTNTINYKLDFFKQHFTPRCLFTKILFTKILFTQMTFYQHEIWSSEPFSIRSKTFRRHFTTFTLFNMSFEPGVLHPTHIAREYSPEEKVVTVSPFSPVVASTAKGKPKEVSRIIQEYCESFDSFTRHRHFKY